MICLLQTHHFTFFKKNVLWFQVSMDDILSVDSYGKLNEIEAHKILKSVPPLKWAPPLEKDPFYLPKCRINIPPPTWNNMVASPKDGQEKSPLTMK